MSGQDQCKTPLAELVLFQNGFYGGKIKRCLIDYDDSSSTNISASVMTEAARLVADAQKTEAHRNELLALLKEVAADDGTNCGPILPAEWLKAARAAIKSAEESQ